MESRLIPYLSFKNNAREAMEFYKSIFGGTLQVTTFKELNASQDPAEDNKVMHSVIETDNGITIMGADTPNSMEHYSHSNISMSLNGDNKEELQTYFEKLSTGGNVVEPLATAPWGDKFGMVTDKFGVHWLVNISAQQE